MIRLSLLLTAIVAVGLASCSGSSSSNPTGPDYSVSVLPLGIGSYWVMDSTIYNRDGSTTIGGVDTIKMRTDTKLDPTDGKTLYDYNGTFVRYIEQNGSMMGGLYAKDTVTYLTSYLYLEYPVTLHDHFRDNYFTQYRYMKFPSALKLDSMAEIVSLYYVDAVDTLIVVPGGSYHCIEYTTDWNFVGVKTPLTYQKDVLFFCPQFGPVQTEHWTIYDTITSTLHLTERSRLTSSKILQ